MASTSLPRRTHRKRISALRLSSDTTSTLPEYIPTAYHNPQHHPDTRLGGGRGANEETIPSDKPPDYPDSAEEADEDTDPESDSNIVYVPQFSPSATLSPRVQTASPRRAKRFLPTQKRRVSSQIPSKSSDPFLDSLLERSVHALEMSNTLLQSSISTQTSLSAILRSDSPGDSTLEARAIGLSSRIRETSDVGASWAVDLEEITRGVDGLFSEGGDEHSDSGVVVGVRRRRSLASASGHKAEGSMSCSLPTSSMESMMRRNRRRPSLDLRQPSDSSAPRLQLGPQSRANIVSPPPRALTQYVASTQDADSIVLPSTIGLRSPPSVHRTPEWKPLYDLASSSTTSLLSTASFSTTSLPPKLTDKPLEPSTPAYNMLSSFVYRPPSSGPATPSTSFTNSFIHSRFRGSRSTSASTERSNDNPTRRRSSPSPKPPDTRNKRRDRSSSSGSQNTTPNRGVSPLALIIHRPMTPPTEESSHSSSCSDGCVAKLTVQSLRKILDDQPVQQDLNASSSRSSSNGRGRLKPPAFMPRTPAPGPQAGTSTATASVSRLFTKGTHSSSTRAPSPPRLSAMKHSRNSSFNTSPLPSPLSPPSPSEPPTTAPAFNPTSTSNLMASTTTSSGTNPPTPTTALIPDMVSKVLLSGRTSASASSSGWSTPNKRISFAELPESYASTRPGGAESSTFKERRDSSRRKRRKGAKGVSSSPDLGGTKDGLLGSGGDGSWWAGWLAPSGLSLNFARQEERMEDRMTRSWGGRMGSGYGGGLDEWAV